MPVPDCCGAITALAAGPGDRLLAVGGAGGWVRLVRGDTEAWAELVGHGGAAPVQLLAFSRCGRTLNSVAGRAVFAWEVQD